MISTGYVCGQRWAARVLVLPVEEPITTDELLERARLTGSDAESPTLLQDYIAAARNQVEQDTGCALLTQTIAVGFDQLPQYLPWPPVQTAAATWTGADGTPVVIDPTTYSIDVLSFPARIAWSVIPAMTSARALYPWTFELVVGWTLETLPPSLKFAVGLLAAHYLTLGRDRVTMGGGATEMPAGYDEAIAPYRLLVLA
jgi:uncharacterized phiE125 gp8 family phage protein